jgi:hypothetical protein
MKAGGKFDPGWPFKGLKSHKTVKLKRRHGEFEQGCVLSESYTVTDALPPILPACRKQLLLHRHPRFFFPENLLVNQFVRDERRLWTEVPMYMIKSE